MKKGDHPLKRRALAELEIRCRRGEGKRSHHPPGLGKNI